MINQSVESLFYLFEKVCTLNIYTYISIDRNLKLLKYPRTLSVNYSRCSLSKRVYCIWEKYVSGRRKRFRSYKVSIYLCPCKRCDHGNCKS